MSEQEYINEPWESTYRTGTTQPPKSRRGCIGVLLVLVILLMGLVTLLSIANIHLFRKVNKAQTKDGPHIYSNEIATTAAFTDPTDASASREHDLLEDPVSPLSPATVTEGLSLQEIYEKAIGSVVSVSGYYPWGGGSTGTGVVLTKDGYIVTNCHVIEGAYAITVLLTDGRELDATLVGKDEVSDLAVLHVQAEDLLPIELGDSSALRVGDTVVAIGDPLGIELRGTMTNGIVSAINRDIQMDGRTMSLIQTNAALNSGNSGGPLINCYGQMVGINTMKMGDNMSSAGVEGLGFAIPSTTVRDIVNQLVSQGYVSGRPDLGIQGETVSVFYQLYYMLPAGYMVTSVEEGSGADRVGVEPSDILLSLDGYRITDSDTLTSLLYNYSPGDVVEVVIYRSGKQYTVKLTVGEAKG